MGASFDTDILVIKENVCVFDTVEKEPFQLLNAEKGRVICFNQLWWHRLVSFVLFQEVWPPGEARDQSLGCIFPIQVIIHSFFAQAIWIHTKETTAKLLCEMKSNQSSYARSDLIMDLVVPLQGKNGNAFWSISFVHSLPGEECIWRSSLLYCWPVAQWPPPHDYNYSHCWFMSTNAFECVLSWVGLQLQWVKTKEKDFLSSHKWTILCSYLLCTEVDITQNKKAKCESHAYSVDKITDPPSQMRNHSWSRYFPGRGNLFWHWE